MSTVMSSFSPLLFARRRDHTVDYETLGIIERACSVFSLVGCVFIILSFKLSNAFQKPINRLVFYASFGNMMANVGTLMSRRYVSAPSSAGCQFQAFLIQWFMPADAFWTLSMAINVYLTFYWKFDAQMLRKVEVPYLIVCYGLPFIPAMTFLFIDHPIKGRFYGDAILWCWVSANWDVWRIITFYGPIWLVILVTIFIYVRAGREIYQKRKVLRNLSIPDPEPMPIIHDPFSSVKTTEVMVTTEFASSASSNPQTDPEAAAGRRDPAPRPRPPNPVYSVTISTSKDKRDSYMEEPPVAPGVSSGRNANNNIRRRAVYEANNAAWSYTKCAILFFTAMLVTWIPSSTNRVYSVVNDAHLSALEYMSAFVLPLQGFWNAIIYIVTSWRACQIMWQDMITWIHDRRSKKSRDVTELVRYETSPRSSGTKAPKKANSRHTYESESMTDLTTP